MIAHGQPYRFPTNTTFYRPPFFDLSKIWSVDFNKAWIFSNISAFSLPWWFFVKANIYDALAGFDLILFIDIVFEENAVKIWYGKPQSLCVGQSAPASLFRAARQAGQDAMYFPFCTRVAYLFAWRSGFYCVFMPWRSDDFGFSAQRQASPRHYRRFLAQIRELFASCSFLSAIDFSSWFDFAYGEFFSRSILVYFLLEMPIMTFTSFRLLIHFSCASPSLFFTDVLWRMMLRFDTFWMPRLHADVLHFASPNTYARMPQSLFDISFASRLHRLLSGFTFPRKG